VGEEHDPAFSDALLNGVVLVIRSGNTASGAASLKGAAVCSVRFSTTWDPRSSEETDYTYSYQEFAQEIPSLVTVESATA